MRICTMLISSVIILQIRHHLQDLKNVCMVDIWKPRADNQTKYYMSVSRLLTKEGRVALCSSGSRDDTLGQEASV